MSSVTFTIPGKPFAKQRPRFSRKSGRAFTPGETVSYERTVGTIANPHFPKPMDGPLKLTVIATFAPPASWSRKKVAEALDRPHTQKPDIDNCVKAIADGLNLIAWADDSQIAEIVARKIWGVTAQTVVRVDALGAA